MTHDVEHKKDRKRISKEFRGKRITDVKVLVEHNVALVVTGLLLTFDDGTSAKLAAGTYASPDELMISWPDV